MFHGLELELRSLPVMQRDMASIRWSVVFQSNVFSFTMFASRALLGKKRARSVARMAFFITSSASLYSSGLRQSKMLLASCWRMLTPMVKWWFSMVEVVYTCARGDFMSIMNLLLKPLWSRSWQMAPTH